MTRQDLSFVLMRLFGFTVAVRAALALPQMIGSLVVSIFAAPSMVFGNVFGSLLPVTLGVAVQVAGGVIIVWKSAALSAWLMALAGGGGEARDSAGGDDA